MSKILNNIMIKNFVKKIILCIVVFCVCFYMSKTTFAQDAQGNIEVIKIKPEIVYQEYDLERELYRPDKSSQYAFGQAHKIWGYADISTLYSNSCFYGVKTITMTIKNNSDENLVVKLRKYGPLDIGVTELKVTIPPDAKTYYATFENLDDDVYYYFSFSAPCDFEGHVTGYKY